MAHQNGLALSRSVMEHGQRADSCIALSGRVSLRASYSSFANAFSRHEVRLANLLNLSI